MNKYYIIILSILTVSISSCNKPGCTDLMAENFNAKATEDDNSCTYELPSTPRILTSEDVDTPSSLPLNPYSEIDYIMKYRTQINSDLLIESNVIIECYGDLQIGKNGSITLMPGAEIHFAQGKGMVVGGEIFSLGSADNPIVFKSIGNSSWNGIQLGSSINVTNKFSYTNIIEGGIDIGGSNVEITNCEISNCADYAVFNESYAAGSVTIQNTLFLNNNNLIKIHQAQVRGLMSSNTYTGNTNNFIYVSTREAANTIHFRKQSVNFQLHNVGNNTSVFCSSPLDSVIIDPGVTLEMGPSTRIAPQNTFICEGTSANWIQITGIDKTADAWGSVTLDGNYVTSMIYTEVSYAGSNTIRVLYGSNNIPITNCILRDGAGCGIFQYQYSGTINTAATFFFNLTSDFC